ncbi:MAG: bifunctional 4-hydroxy-3-methylbut-2-enyl diphosphate reductase/30S ribosomal protein S1 [Oscillospiraceae bacterium]
MLTNCKICTAATAGFCFGVDRAVKIVYNNLDNRQQVVTLGPIIHNKNVVADIEARGGRTVADLSGIRAGDTVIIRSHGVEKCVYDALADIGADIVDATCPFVARIHKIAAEQSAQGFTVLIAGDQDHPEVRGIVGHSTGRAAVIANETELADAVKTLSLKADKTVLLAQTTFSTDEWARVKISAQRLLPGLTVYETICSATKDRQNEARELAKRADIMLIAGDRHSSNTRKLQLVCEPYAPCFLIENARELYGIDFSGAKIIGISAGASTPAYIIKEVQQTMNEIINGIDEDFDFAEALEQSLIKIHTGKKVTGLITSVNNSEAIVDIGTKHTGYVPLAELTDDSTLKPSDVVKVGDTVELVVMKIDDQNGIVTLSKRKVDAMVGYEKLLKARDEDSVLTGTVTNVVKGGVLVLANGVKVFIPASQATARRDDKLDDLLRKTVNFKIIDLNEQKQRAVGSIRAVAKEMKSAAQAKFFETAVAGAVVTGEVKSITDYGVFVDLGGIDGLIRKLDLSWDRIKHPSDVVSVGETIEVIIKDIDKEAGKVSLVYRKPAENPWEVFKANYAAGQVAKVKIVSLTNFGAFAQIIKGIDGLIHISQIANQHVTNVADILAVGQEIDAKITEIDYDKKRISLSVRALLPEDSDDDAGEPQE